MTGSGGAAGGSLVPFDPIDFLTVADDLIAKASPSEADLRSAISRAYYALHIRARERLVARGKMRRTGTGEEHRIVIETLRALGGPHGDQLDTLRIRRGIADYELDVHLALPDARTAVNVAKYVYPRL